VLDWTLYSSTLEATEAKHHAYTTAPFCTFITERKDQSTPRKKKKPRPEERPPDFYLKELVPHDSNPGWLSEPLLQRVRLSSYTVRVLA